jgi:endonuclease/exonuclease/phosphatase family metal-dependent hydrolase
VLSACNDDFLAQTGDCRLCLAANVGGSIDDISTACTVPGPLYAYEGAFGVGLLTNQPVLESGEIVFEGSTINRRGAQYAKLDTALGPVNVFCTHLTANLTIDYPREAGSWAEEQAGQIATIQAFIDERAAGEAVVFLGDLNTGPAGEGIVAELAQNYQLLVDQSWANPFVDQVGTCTYCAANPLVGSAGDDTQTVLIDHVLFRGAEGTFTSSRLLDEDVSIQSATDGAVTTKLSDHYGVQVVWSR